MPLGLKLEQDENEKVRIWRWNMMEAAGIGLKARNELSLSPSDLHQILKAKEQGCKDAILVEIFGE